MLRQWFCYSVILGVASLGASSYEYEIEKELSQSIGAIEMDDFDSEGLSLFGMELEEGEELLFPWGGREDFSAFVEEKARAALADIDDEFMDEAEASVETVMIPSTERIPTRSNKLLSSRPRIIPSDPK